MGDTQERFVGIPHDTPLSRPMNTWKRLAVISLFGGAGFAVVVAGIVGAIAWYNSRPEQPRTWNTTAIVAEGPPTFNAIDNGKKIHFGFSLENKTATDYQIDSASSIKLLVKTRDGTFSPPLSSELYTYLSLYLLNKRLSY